ncbi:MAG: sugar phosphate isomerase/epimerase family protein [Gemmataceae bacterium]
MPRPIILFSGPFADLPLEELAGRASSWSYAGLELAIWGDHLDIHRLLDDSDYATRKLACLSTHELQAPVIAAHRLSQALGDVIDERHRDLVPEHVWGNGDPAGVRRRAVDEMVATIRAAQRLGASAVSGFTGSPIWSYVVGHPGPSAEQVERAFHDFAATWHPILDVCHETGVRFACEVHPGQLAFDFYSSERLLDSIDRRPEFGFCVDPAHLHWQGVDPAAFVRHFGERVYHVHLRDVAILLNGRSGLLNSYFSSGDSRRGWEFRAPGRGGVDWENFMRALNAVGYDGPLSVDFHDAGLDRDFGAAEAAKFARQLDFPSCKREEPPAFR